MRIAARALLGFVILAALAYPAGAQEAEGETEKTIEAPSPDGKFAFLHTVGAEHKTFDLIEKKSGKVLLRVVDSDDGIGNRLSADVLWAPDSKRFAITYMIVRLGTGVSVYFRTGDTFREIKLPELEADIPDRLTRGKKFGHIAALNSTSAVRWQKDGSLEVEVVYMIDGESGSITATRTVVLGFDRSAKARIRKSTIEFKTENESGD
jgi:hypothetical protein